MTVTVLLIDDDREFLDILSERLTIRGMEVTTAASGQTALDLMAKERFDVVVLDLQMPEMDGLQVLAQLAARNSTQPVILLTGHATVSRGVQAMKLGATDVLEKPVDIRELAEKIKSAASAGQRREANGPASGTTQSTGRPQGLAKLFRTLFSRDG